MYIPPRWISIYVHRTVHDTQTALLDIYVLQQQLSFTGVHPEREMPVSDALSASRKAS